MLLRAPFFPIISATISTPYQDGVMAKRSGQPKQIPPMFFDSDASQMEYELDWLAGWDNTDVDLVAVLEAKTNIVAAVKLMSDAQLHREVHKMKQRWHVAIKPWTPELDWQKAIVNQVTRRGQRHVLV